MEESKLRERINDILGYHILSSKDFAKIYKGNININEYIKDINIFCLQFYEIYDLNLQNKYIIHVNKIDRIYMIDNNGYLNEERYIVYLLMDYELMINYENNEKISIKFDKSIKEEIILSGISSKNFANVIVLYIINRKK